MVSYFIFFMNCIRVSLCVSVFVFLYVYVCLVFSVFCFFFILFSKERQENGWVGRLWEELGKGNHDKNVLSEKYLQLKNVKYKKWRGFWYKDTFEIYILVFNDTTEDLRISKLKKRSSVSLFLPWHLFHPFLSSFLLLFLSYITLLLFI